jgi:Tfp pilus assembly protein PilV
MPSIRALIAAGALLVAAPLHAAPGPEQVADAALRVAPVPGTRKDVGAQVKTTLDRYAQLNEGNVSGMVALNIVRPDVPAEPKPAPAPLATSGLASKPLPTATVPGLAPPPLPRTLTPKKPMSIPSIPKLGSSPTIQPPPAAAAPAHAPAAPSTSLTQGWDAVAIPDVTDALDPSSPVTVTEETPTVAQEQNNTVLGLEAPRPRTASIHNFETATGEMSTDQLNTLNERAQMSTRELAPLERADSQAPTTVRADVHDADTVGVGDEISVALHAPEAAVEASVDPATTLPGHTPATPRAAVRPESMPEWAPTGSVPLFDYNAATPPPPADKIRTSTPDYSPAESVPLAAARAPIDDSAPQRPMLPSSRLPLIAGIVFGVGVVGAFGYYVVTHLGGKTTETTAQTKPIAATRDAAVALAAKPDAAATVAAKPDAATQVAAVVPDAAAAVPADAAVEIDATELAAVSPDAAVATKAVATKASDQLEVTSTPAGARVFVDGSDIGKTPVKTPGSADRHTLAVLLPGHDLYIAEVDGAGVYNITLEPVKFPKSGPGIKIEKCKQKNRYYIYLDGKPSGQTCPTEKRIIASGLGSHTVEVYDIVTETKKKYEVDIEDARLSTRVRIEE